MRIAPSFRIGYKRRGQLLQCYGEHLDDRLAWLGALQCYPRKMLRNLICDLWSKLELLIAAGNQHGGFDLKRTSDLFNPVCVELTMPLFEALDLLA